MRGRRGGVRCDRRRFLGRRRLRRAARPGGKEGAVVISLGIAVSVQMGRSTLGEVALLVTAGRIGMPALEPFHVHPIVPCPMNSRIVAGFSRACESDGKTRSWRVARGAWRVARGDQDSLAEREPDAALMWRTA